MNAIETKRLILRNWTKGDCEPFYRMSNDSKVMEFMPKCLSREESDLFVEKTIQLIIKNGYGLWAAETKETHAFIGFVGLNSPTFQSHFTPCMEVGWRLDSNYWGKGYATEAAKEALRFGFISLGLEEIVSFTVPKNTRSRKVMERLGMQYNPKDDFNHPNLKVDDPLCQHVLYRLKRNAWKPEV